MISVLSYVFPGVLPRVSRFFQVFQCKTMAFPMVSGRPPGTGRRQEMTWAERGDHAAQKAESEAIWKGAMRAETEV